MCPKGEQKPYGNVNPEGGPRRNPRNALTWLNYKAYWI